MKIHSNNLISKKRFLNLISLGLLSTVFGWMFFRNKKQNKNKKVKMLTADGKLVEVDIAKVKSNNSKTQASNIEIKKWMDSKEEIPSNNPYGR